MRITPQELETIRATFKDNEDLLKLMRKIFLPEQDPTVPLGQSIDLWMTIKVDEMTTEQALINLKARNSLIMHIEQQLLVLRSLAEKEDETPEEAVTRLKQDSTR